VTVRKAKGESGLKAVRPRKASGEGRTVLAALLAILLASCTTAEQSGTELTSSGFNSMASSTASTDSAAGMVMSADSDTALPEQVAYLPVSKPGGGEFAAIATDTQATAAAPTAETAAASQPPTDRQQSVTKRQARQPAAETAAADASQAAKAEPEPATTAAIPVPTAKESAPADKNQVIVTATDPAATPQSIEPKKRGFLSAFFGGSAKSEKPAVAQIAAAAPVRQQKPSEITQITSTEQAKPEKAKPLIQLASASGEEAKPLVARASLNGGDLDPLPGVRQTALFEIKRKSGIDDDSDVDLHEDEDGPVQLASAAGLARLAPNGLLTQTDRVDVACLKPSLVRVLKTVERHYGRKIMVTSGYRSPSHNRRARGAKNSLHMYCAAADVQVQGVSKWELASFARTMPGRGGIGTYCHTESVHIDVGPERDWNWRCRRRR
jgi:uncharacterized protein YcbK (DUF882 family)